MTVTLPDKGFYGLDYRTLIGLHRYIGRASSALKPGDPSWDIWVAGLPFLLAPAEERTYIRESNTIRRERFDSARDPGENSLDSSIWLRSWTSWHMGAGQAQAEPLELDPEVARFRFSRSAGVNPWTPGRLSLLRRMVQYRANGVNSVLGVAGRGLLEARSDGVYLNGTQIYTGTVTRIAVGGTHWAGVSGTGTMVYGTYDGATTGTVTGLTGVSLVAYQKNRFWAVDGANSLREVPSLTGAASTAILFPGASQILDIDSGVAGVYVMTDEGLTNIHVITASDTGALNPPVNVATLPRGEVGRFLYGYLGRYLAIGSSRGLRVADTGTSQSLPIGPLVVEMPSAPADVTADGNYLWVTTAGSDIDSTGDGTVLRPGTYRIDLSRVVESNQAYGETAAARFPYATDQYAEVPGTPVSLSTYNGLLYLVLSDGQEWRTHPGGTPVPYGWLETGKITFATGESKSWQSVFVDTSGLGGLGILGDSGLGWAQITQTVVPLPYTGSFDIDSMIHPPGSGLDLRLILQSASPGITDPVLETVGLRALPAAKRTRKILLPLLCFDQEVDRNQTPIGYEGFSYDRIADLELLENTGRIIRVLDTRSNETVSCQIDRVSFEGQTPPDRRLKNYGGLLNLVLLIV